MQLSPLQRRLWWINESALNAPGFNIAVLLETSAVITAEWVAAIEARCVALGLGDYTLNYGADMLAWQRQSQSLIRVQQHDARQHTPDHPNALQRAEQLAQHHFDLTREAPLNLHVIYDEEKTYFLLVCCHIVFDGTSAALLLAGLAKQPVVMPHYGLDLPALYPPAEATMNADAGVQQWQQRLANVKDGLLNLPPQAGEVAILTMDESLQMRIRQHCRTHKTRLSAWLMAQWAKWLQLRCNKAQINLGTVLENRQSDSSKLALGLHVSILPLLIREATAAQIEAQLASLRHFPFVPYEQLSQLPEFADIDTWFDCFFGFHHWPRQQVELYGLPWNICIFAQNLARYPLALDVFRLGKTMQLKVEKSADFLGLSSHEVGQQYLQFLSSQLNSEPLSMPSCDTGDLKAAPTTSSPSRTDNI